MVGGEEEVERILLAESRKSRTCLSVSVCLPAVCKAFRLSSSSTGVKLHLPYLRLL